MKRSMSLSGEACLSVPPPVRGERAQESWVRLTRTVLLSWLGPERGQEAW